MKVKKFGCIISSAIFTAYKLVQFAFNVIAKGLSSLMVTTGLIVPATYFLFGVVLTALFGFSVSDGSTNAVIYKTGMVISFVIAVLVFVYNVFIRPVKRATRSKNAKHKLDKLPEQNTVQTPAPLPPAYVGDAYESAPPRRQTYPVQTSDEYYAGARMPERRLTGKEMPLIYRSKVHEGIIVYEYSDCFRLYREQNGKLVLVKIQPKN